jgi:hypothetical protein
MIRSGAAGQPEPDRSPLRILQPLLSAIRKPLLSVFRDAALRFTLSAAAWRARLPHWWKHLAAELSLDLRPHKTKQIRKSKAKGNSPRPPTPGKLI